MRNTKIKTSGLTAILKSLNFETNVVVNHIPHGYKTILTAMRNDSIIEMHLTLKEFLFREDSIIKVRFYNLKTDNETIVEKAIDTSDRETVAKSILTAFEEANNQNMIFIESVLKLMYLAIVNTKAIKEYYSAQKAISRVCKLANEAKW